MRGQIRSSRWIRWSLAAVLASALPLLSAAASGRTEPSENRAAPAPGEPYASTYVRLPSPSVLIRGGTLLTGTGTLLPRGDVLLEQGRIRAVGENLPVPEGVTVVDAEGRFVTPGVIDVHSHLGVYASPGIAAVSDGNEATAPVTAEVWAEHSIWPQDPQFPLALAGGVTTMQILPGSANLIGGRGVIVKNIASRTMQGMKFPGAPHTLKMACGENPKRVYGERQRPPSTRMGNVAGYRAAWIKADAYRRKMKAEGEGGSRKGKPAGPPQERDLQLETLAGVLEGDILVQNHCYRADEMAIMIDLAKEFGYKITAFHHAVEAYKIADLLAANGICAAVWADWWGFKLEAYDGIRENAALVDAAGGCAVIHSDSAEGIQRLNQEAAKAMAAGQRLGLDLPPERVIRWITLNAARMLGIEAQTGSLEPGKMADVVIWSGDPFSVYSVADHVYLDGALVYDRHNPRFQPRTDFEIGLFPEGRP